MCECKNKKNFVLNNDYAKNAKAKQMKKVIVSRLQWARVDFHADDECMTAIDVVSLVYDLFHFLSSVYKGRSVVMAVCCTVATKK